MVASSKKKTDKNPDVQAEAQDQVKAAAPLPAKVPALVALHITPGPAGQPLRHTIIGKAVAHDDGEGYTLDLDLIPTNGGRIILRVPKIKPAQDHAGSR
jgi:hypothetical protein